MSIPVYLPDGTVVGSASVHDDGHSILIRIPGKEPIADLMAEGLIGLSTVYMTNVARDRVAEQGETNVQ